MVDITNKLNQIIKMVDDGRYFTINRARQYGKTTMLSAITRALKDRYYVIKLSFESSDDIFTSLEAFCSSICEDFYDILSLTDIDSKILNVLEPKLNSQLPLRDFSRRITKVCKLADKPIILLIDEVDKNSNNRVLLGFLGMLRNKYLNMVDGLDHSFKSVILAGVYDIKNLKLKFRSEEEARYNSPWNIATDFNVDMSFNPKEIATMLVDYEQDYHTGMDIQAISQEIHNYTSGYPYLVSCICKTIHEKLEQDWSLNGIQKAIKTIMLDKSTLFDDVIKNINNYPEFGTLVDNILVGGKTVPFNNYNPNIELGVIFGVLKSVDNIVCISNRIFEIFLYDYFIVDRLIKDIVFSKYNGEKSQFIENGKLNMEQVILKFQEFMKCEYNDSRKSFLEDEGRLLFLCFLKPIINGTGFYYVEPQTRNTTRMDIVVTYGGEEHIIELKIWHGDKLHQQAYQQLLGYMDNRNQSTGYLITFSFNKDKEYTSSWNDFKQKRIFEVIV